jgi:hypothetical protein
VTKKVWETLIQTIGVGHQVMLVRLPERERDFSHKSSGIPSVMGTGVRFPGIKRLVREPVRFVTSV